MIRRQYDLYKSMAYRGYSGKLDGVNPVIQYNSGNVPK